MEQEIELVSFDERELIFKKGWFKEYGTTKVVDVELVGKQLLKDRQSKGMSPYIDIQPIQEDLYKNTRYTFSYEKDPSTGIKYGLVADIHKDGNVMWKGITIIDGRMSLNLNLDADLKKWVVLRYCSRIKGSPFAISQPVYKVFDAEIEAEKTIATMEMMENAIAKCRLMEGKQLAFFARTLGIAIPKGTSEKVLRGEVSKKAMNDPNLFVTKFTNADRTYAEAYCNGIALNIIRFTHEGGYRYRELPLGGNEQSVIQYLRENPEINREILREIDLADEAVNALKREEKPEVKPGKKQKIEEI